MTPPKSPNFSTVKFSMGFPCSSTLIYKAHTDGTKGERMVAIKCQSSSNSMPGGRERFVHIELCMFTDHFILSIIVFLIVSDYFRNFFMLTID